MNPEKLIANLIRDEGLRLKPYLDTEGKLTIGVGRNLHDNGISEQEAKALLDNDIQSHCRDLDQHIGWWKTLDEVRARALANMAFNLGIHRLLGFKNMLIALQNGNWVEAAKQAKDSKWYTQVGTRADRIIHMFETGSDPSSITPSIG